MNNNVKFIFSFVAGAAVGSAVAYKLLKTKYEKIAQEEIDSVKEMYGRKYDEMAKDQKTISEYHELTARYSSDDTDKPEQKGGSESTDEESDIRVVAPEEVGMYTEYPIHTLYYYTEDEVLATEVGDPICDLEMTVGEDFAEHFGDYEDDAVYVKNDKLHCYYEILKEPKAFKDVKIENAIPMVDNRWEE